MATSPKSFTYDIVSEGSVFYSDGRQTVKDPVCGEALEMLENLGDRVVRVVRMWQ